MRGFLTTIFIILFVSAKSNSLYPSDSVCPLDHSSKVYHKLPPIALENIKFTEEDLVTGIRFVIITNRKTEKDKNGLITFGNTRGNDLHYLVVSRKGQEWYLKEHKNFTTSFNSADTYKSLLFYVHGYGKTFPGVIHDGAAFVNYYDVNLVIFDWPTEYISLSKIDTYRFSKINAINSAENFASVLNDFQNYKRQYWQDDQRKTTLMAHSLGNSILEKAVNDSMFAGLDKNLFTNIILNAPAVEFKEHDRWVECLNLQQNLFVTSNHKDLSFFGIWWLTMKKQLGGIKQPAMAENAVYVNFSTAAGRSHNSFLNPDKLNSNLKVKQFYDTIFQGGKIETKNSCMFLNKQENYYLR